MNLDRLISLIGRKKVSDLEKLNILIVGIGGVGGYAFESLVRSGVGNFTIVDGDLIDETNLNRQIIANSFNIGKLKVNEARSRALSINPSVNIDVLPLFLDESNISIINIKSFDYVIDACDTTLTKVLLISLCLKNNIKIVSSMGTAKKMDASKIYITSLDKTSHDPLARKLRKLISKEDQKKVIVVSSVEEARDIKELGSNSFVPAVAGLFITNYIINDMCNKD